MTNVLTMIVYNIDMDDKEYPEAPAGIKVMSNGGGYDMERKRIAYGPGTFGPDTSPITSENARELWERRYELAREAAAQAIASAPGNVSGNVLGGWKTIVAAQVMLAQRIEAGRASTEAAKFIARAADLIPDARQQAGNTQNNVQINVSEDVLRRILGDTGGQVLDL